MMCQRVWWVGRRGVCNVVPGEKKEFRQPTELPIKDPDYFWIQPHDCTLKTWRDIEQEYACALLVRFSQKCAPERRMLNIESGDLFICRRGCLHPCLAPPCDDPQYPSTLEKILYRLSRLAALAIFLGLVYTSCRLKVWGPSGPTLDVILGDSDNKVEQLGSVGTVLAKWWNVGVAMMFSGVKWVFPPADREPGYDERDFVMEVQEDLKDRKEREAAPPFKEDENIFEQWELVYNYVPEPPKLEVEMVDDTDWYWMEHRDPEYLKPSKSPVPYEKGARMLKKLRDQDGVTLASAYTDLCVEWQVTKGAVEEVEIECFEDSPLGIICKRKRERKKKVKIDPKDCETCPLDKTEEPDK